MNEVNETAVEELTAITAVWRKYMATNATTLRMAEIVDAACDAITSPQAMTFRELMLRGMSEILSPDSDGRDRTSAERLAEAIADIADFAFIHISVRNRKNAKPKKERTRR